MFRLGALPGFPNFESFLVESEAAKNNQWQFHMPPSLHVSFQDGNYRTSALNPALALILQKNKELQNEKVGDMIISENVSGDVARTGIEPATQGFSVLQIRS